MEMMIVVGMMNAVSGEIKYGEGISLYDTPSFLIVYYGIIIVVIVAIGNSYEPGQCLSLYAAFVIQFMFVQSHHSTVFVVCILTFSQIVSNSIDL